MRTLLILGRVSNLPTVWTDCLAAWCLAGRGSPAALAGVMAACSFLYVGGMFLNDAFDSVFDSHHRRDRPIPSGAIKEAEVWRWGFLWLILGLAVVAWIGGQVLWWAVALCICILLYNAIHKWVPFAPFVMGACRLCVYFVAASASDGITGEIVWKGIALAAYIVGISYLARKESARVRINFWPSLLLAAPVVFAAVIDDGPSWKPAALYSILLGAWALAALSRSIAQIQPNIGCTVSRLLAGIALVDLLAVASTTDPWLMFFPAAFAAALLLQRSIPAT